MSTKARPGTATSRTGTAANIAFEPDPNIAGRDPVAELKFNASTRRQWDAAIKATKRELAASVSRDSGLPWHADTPQVRDAFNRRLVKEVPEFRAGWRKVSPANQLLYLSLPFESFCRKMAEVSQCPKTPSDLADALLFPDLNTSGPLSGCCPAFVHWFVQRFAPSDPEAVRTGLAFAQWLLMGIPGFRRYVRRFPANKRAMVRDELAGKISGLSPAGQVFGTIAITGWNTTLDYIAEVFDSQFKPRHVVEYRKLVQQFHGDDLISKMCKRKPPWVGQCVRRIVSELFGSLAGEELRLTLQRQRGHNWARLRQLLGDFLRGVEYDAEIMFPQEPAVSDAWLERARELGLEQAAIAARADAAAETDFRAIVTGLVNNPPLFSRIVWLYMARPSWLLDSIGKLLHHWNTESSAESVSREQRLEMLAWPELRRGMGAGTVAAILAKALRGDEAASRSDHVVRKEIQRKFGLKLQKRPKRRGGLPPSSRH